MTGKAIRTQSSRTTTHQGDLFRVDTTWYLMMRGMVGDGAVASMGPHAYTAYSVLKSGADLRTGRVSMSAADIARAGGMSERQVSRALDTLESMGSLTRIHKTGKNEYQLRERLLVAQTDGTPIGHATWNYLPDMPKIAAELRSMLSSEGLAGGANIHIERLNIQVVHGSTAIGVQFNSDEQELPPKWVEVIQKGRNKNRETLP